MTNRFTRIAAVAAGLLVAGSVGLALAQGDPIAARKDNFKMAGGAMKATKAIVDAGGDTKAASAEAEKLIKMAKANVALFPAGSDKGDTKAKPEIWQNKADFDSKFKSLEDAAMKLDVAAKSGDAAALKAAFGAVGGTCKACHDVYRVN